MTVVLVEHEVGPTKTTGGRVEVIEGGSYRVSAFSGTFTTIVTFGNYAADIAI